MNKTIKLTSEQIEFLYKNSEEYGGFRKGGEELKKKNDEQKEV